MRPIGNRQLLRNGLIYWAVFTAGYGAFRLVEHDEWRWDHLVQSYVGMLVGFFIVWMINLDRKADASSPPNGGKP